MMISREIHTKFPDATGNVSRVRFLEVTISIN